MDKKIIKKKYIKPSTEVYNINTSQILCSSPFDEDPFEWGFPGA